MTVSAKLTQITEQPSRVQVLRRVLGSLSTLGPAVDLLKPCVEGSENLPRDGRCLLVGNHTQGGMEVFLIPHFVRRAIGTQVRPLAERAMGKIGGPLGVSPPPSAPSSARPRVRWN